VATPWQSAGTRRFTGGGARGRLIVGLGPLLLYAALALLLWGPWVLGAPRSTLLAANDIDPSAYVWFFAWWPHALLHGLNPFYVELIFVPDGYNLAWVTSMPGPSLLLAPVTLTLGPVMTWNLISFASPALSAWTAFLLCRHVSGTLLPALLGGYLFGFSPYMLSQLRGAPQLALVALLPLLVLLVLRHVEGSMSDRRFTVAMTAVLTAQLLVSTEVLATAVVFGAFALAAAYLLFPELRRALRRAVLLVGVALLVTAVLASPLLAYVFFGRRTLPEQALAQYPADALSFLVPGDLVAATSERVGVATPSWATGAAYLGVPLVALVAAFAWSHRRRRAARLVLVVFAAGAIAALGTTLHVAGEKTGVPLPWRAFAELPLLRYAIPLRFSVFVFLAAALVVTLWLAWRPSGPRWALTGLAVLFVLPSVGNVQWRTPLRNVAFFEDGSYRAYLQERDRVLTMPVAGRNMRWHVQADFSFAMAAGYLGATPESYTRYPAWRLLSAGAFARVGADSPAQLRRFVDDKGVTVIVADRDLARPWRRLFEDLAGRPEEAAGVLVYRLSPPWGERRRGSVSSDARPRDRLYVQRDAPALDVGDRAGLQRGADHRRHRQGRVRLARGERSAVRGDRGRQRLRGSNRGGLSGPARR
jgi:hypothetical protein